MAQISRNILTFLDLWRSKENRKPLILRGARQVGKSHVVRQFATRKFKYLLEVNFERNPEVGALITKNSTKRAVELLEIQYGTPIVTGETLIFLDEVQAAPEVLGALRYFYEEIHALHIIAAGSLLDFALIDKSISMPVGRVEYAYLGPITFEEFMSALGEDRLLKYIQDFELLVESESIPAAIHAKAMELVRTFILVGGMPEAVSVYVTSHSLPQVEEVKQALFASYRDDFSKYMKRVDVGAVRKVFERVPKLIGERIKYVQIDRDMRSSKVADTINLLTYARVLSKVRHTSSNGIPLGAEASDTLFKLLFVDVGLVTTACQISPSEIELSKELDLVHKGALAEQFIGQHLLYRGSPSEEPALFFWQREERNSSAEIDYVISDRGEIVPVEVKAGNGGTLRSLHYFMAEKHIETGIKFDSQLPRIIKSTASLANGTRLPYEILSLPHYLVGEASRLLKIHRGVGK